jgi:surface protein
MIQAITGTNLTAYLQTEDNRINTSVAKSKIRHLFKFTNDMDKSIVYAYARTENIENRYTEFDFFYNATPDIYLGRIDLKPAGYWKYEVYEVSWTGQVTISSGFAPATETDVLSPSASNKGIAQGLVTKGKMYVADASGTAQVQYNQYVEPTTTNYIYTGSSAVSEFVFGIDTTNTSTGSSLSTEFKLPLTTSTGLNAVVDWGDSTTDTITAYNAAEVTHTYASGGTYTISITGTLPGFKFNNAGDKLKIINISSWGVLDITTTNTFYGCTNLTCSATDAPTITSTNLTSTFQSCTNFNGNIGNWDVSAVTNMANIFHTATAFNNGGSSSIGSWNTSLVTDMSRAFNTATAFNQNIGAWNVEAVTTIVFFMSNKTAANYSAANLDAIYNGWSTQSVQPNLTISFGSIKYTAAGQTGRNTLDNAPNNWTITDGGI